MALWNKVVSGFDREDETVNFGTRRIAENNGSLYETSTVATIQSDKKVEGKPNVSASVQYSRVCVTVDKSITVFENESCEEILLSVSFESFITCYCISHDGIFLFLVLSNGMLYCLDLLNKGQVIFTKNIIQGTNKVMSIYSQNESHECINIYLIMTNGAIYRISQFTHSSILNEIKIDDAEEKMTQHIKFDQLFKGFSCDEVIYATIGMVGKEISIAMLCSRILFMWPSEQYNNFNTSNYTYTKVKFFKNSISMLCLRSDHKLSMICPQTLLATKVYTTIPVFNFEIIEGKNNSSCEIVVLTTNSDSTAQSLNVLTFPDFQKKFQLSVPFVSYLVEIVNPCDEIILYMEGINQFNNGIEYIDTLRIKAVSEGIPEDQLQRLLRREKFDAAEAFANKFDLSVEPIYCAKVALLLSQFGPWAKKVSDPIQIDMLLTMFDKIENVQYVVECCSKALIPDYKQMRKILLYARSRIMENADKDKYLHLLSSINNILDKLETFHMIWGYKRGLECYDDDTMKEWIRFSRANFMEEYKTHLSLGEMEAATLIWTRHFPDLITYISNIETLEDTFAILPEKIPPLTLWPWLSHFIPTLLSFIPSAINQIIFWGCKKVKSFEQFYHSEWPKIGIDFMEKFIKLLKFEKNYQSLYFQQEYLNKNFKLKQLTTLTQAMLDIQKLKVNYRLTISLDSYTDDPLKVSYMLLDKIHVNIIPEFVNTFLKQYMLNNSLNDDYVLSTYIENTIKNYNWRSNEQTLWEKRVVIIIDLIEDIEIKLQQTLEIVKRASVPWSSTIETLAEMSQNFDHILASQIRIECNYVPIKLILKKYGYERIGINDKLIQYIIKKNYDTMISDIQQITKNNLSKRNAFSSCMHYYLSRGNFENVMKTLNSLESDLLLYCCAQIVNYVAASLTLKVLPEYVMYYIEMFGWLKLQLQKHSNECKTESYYCKSIINNMNAIKSRYFLKKNFQIDVTDEEYYVKKKQVLENYVKRLNNAELTKDESLFTMYKKVIKVADLLELCRMDAISILLELVKDVNLLNYFIGYKKGQLNIMTDECLYVQKICLLVIQHAKADSNIAAIIKNLSSAALCVCSDDQLESMLLLYHWSRLYEECSNKSLTCDSSSEEMKHEEISRTGWKLYTIYNDLSTGVDESLLPLLRDAIFVQQLYITKLVPDYHKKIDMKRLTNGETARDCNSLNPDDFLKKLLDRIMGLRLEHSDYCLLQIIKSLYFNCCIISGTSDTLLKEIKSMFVQFSTILLKKVINSRKFDPQLSLSCLFILPDSEACNWISTACKLFQPDCIRHLRITIFGYEYFRLTKNQTFLEMFQNNKILHYWAQKLSVYSISYKEVLTSDITAKRKILQDIMSCCGDMIPLFEEFCSDFGFKFQDCLLIYLEWVIKTWNPKLNMNNHDRNKEFRINEDEINELRRKCNHIASYILDKCALKNCVQTLLSQVNFYYYEVFIILMDIIEDKNIEQRYYFHFLQNYTRISPPTQMEYDEWIHRNPGHTSLPPIAKWRLPFLFNELWKLLTPEFNLKTYEKWLDIAPTLKLQPNIICTLAIKGEVTHALENKHKMAKWSLCSKNSSLLNYIKKCIEKMSGPDALYYGTAALYYVVNHTPPGADQVAAVEECYKYARLSIQKSTTFEEGMLEKIKFKYLRFTTEHILHTHGLGNENYLSLIRNPNKLIRELYTDESIPQRYQCALDNKPDINSAVNLICQLYSISVVKLRIELLHEWLQPDVRYTKFNQSEVTETFLVTANSEWNSNCDDNLLRACYILGDGDLDLSANYLINIGFGDNNENYSSELRYRALRVLQALFDTTELENLTKRDYQTIRNYIKSLKYISTLESLGISYSVNTFETCSKYELVQILWKTQSYSPQALVVIAQLCIDFKIYEYSLWDKNLTKLAKLLMVNELKNILLQVRNINVIVNSNGYLLGWKVIISEPLRKMDVNPTSEQIEDCLETLQLLYSCPVVHMLNFNDIVKYCFQSQQPHFALTLLPFLNDDDIVFVLNKIKCTFNIEKAVKDLNSLLSNGIFCIDYIDAYEVCYNVMRKKSMIIN
ncbi:kinetochore component rough deal [Xylocopa sonorina]|uniref:kinetochore component rough deal n=1 Tax=Xylocopa sonorina TaxID=1818115 RepID=UPI00403B2173